ncbi:MAG: hypothetical protein C0392_01440 [Syntrophus sp. (in: bacteria)]|nr:hypothetical protein [Syntrophus sp. (in: bacteria)]
MKTKGAITRRDFIKGTAGVLLSAGLGSMVPFEGMAQSRSKVILIRDSNVLGPQGEINEKVLQSMLDEAVRVLADEKDPISGWRTYFKKTDIVGIKSNVWRYLSTPAELEKAIKQRIMDIGVEEKNISIDDRGVKDNPIFVNSTALINVRPTRVHHWAGVGSCLKNYIMFVPTPSAYHDNGCSDLGKIWTLPMVKGKTRLNILVALTPQFYGRGANFFDRRYVWPYKGLIMGTDPVAVDAVGAELLRLKRIAHFGEDRPLDVAPIHITVAEYKYHLGVSDIKRIDIRRIGWKEDILL